MSYALTDRLASQYPVRLLCRTLGVSRSGFYAWRARRGQPESARARTDHGLTVEIASIFREHRGRYGAPRIHAELRGRSVRVGRKRVARLMRRAKLRAARPRCSARTTDSAHALPVAGNVLGRSFEVAAPDTTWAADITYVPTGEGWLYLAVVLDLCSRRVVGHATSSALGRRLVIAALESALGRRRPASGLLCHSDRGSQYASADYQALLHQHGIACSMSRRGNCWDNAPVESFFATLKRELVDEAGYRTRVEARRSLFAYIETYYNARRRHSSLGYRTPREYEALLGEQVSRTHSLKAA